VPSPYRHAAMAALGLPAAPAPYPDAAPADPLA